MNNLLITLYAVLDSDYWTLNDIVTWSDNVILQLAVPKKWLIDLSLCQTIDEARLIISNARNEFDIYLPQNITELLFGLEIVKFETKKISFEELELNLFQIEDYFGSGSYICESVESMLNNKDKYNFYRSLAEKALMNLQSINIETHRSFLEQT